MSLERSAIATLLPHSGDMVLLDRVVSIDDKTIVCRTRSHLRPDNPLRDAGQLGACNALEYAAQAMALHAALQNRTDPATAGGHGVIAGVRKLTCSVDRLDNLNDDLVVQAALLMGDANVAQYTFEVTTGKLSIASGRVTVLFQSHQDVGATH